MSLLSTANGFGKSPASESGALNYWTFAEITAAGQIPGQYAGNVPIYWPLICADFAANGIGSVLSLIGAVGTFAHESASRFAAIHEFGTDFSRYGYAPNGKDFGGRGLIQTTWKSNYDRVQAMTGIPCAADPDLLYVPENAVAAARVYWVDHDLATVCERQDWMECRKRVYGAQDPVGYARIKYAADRLIPLAQQRGYL